MPVPRHTLCGSCPGTPAETRSPVEPRAGWPHAGGILAWRLSIPCGQQRVHALVQVRRWREVECPHHLVPSRSGSSGDVMASANEILPGEKKRFPSRSRSLAYRSNAKRFPPSTSVFIFSADGPEGFCSNGSRPHSNVRHSEGSSEKGGDPQGVSQTCHGNLLVWRANLPPTPELP